MTKMYKRYGWDKTIRLDEKCFKDNLGEGNFIFVGSSGDMFAENVKSEWIEKVLYHCCAYSENTYLFQSKNPKRFKDFHFPAEDNTILATTLETNRVIFNIKCPHIFKRFEFMYMLKLHDLKLEQKIKLKRMITIEPIMDFDINPFLEILEKIHPFQINIGADSGHNNLPEPPKEKLIEFIDELKKTDIKIHLKDNLQRLLK
jgi:hypothetical protein